MLEFTPMKVLLLGDLILDRYYVVNKDDCLDEAYPTFEVEEIIPKTGGVGNVNENLIVFSHYFNFNIIKVGSYQSQAVKSRLVSFEPFQIHSKFTEDNSNRPSDLLDQSVMEQTLIDCAPYDLGIISDYGYGMANEKLIQLAKQHCKMLMVDPRGKELNKYRGVDFIFPNQKELNELTHFLPRETSLDSRLEHIRKFFNIKAIVLKLGKMGSYLYSEGIRRRFYPRVLSDFCEKAVIDTTGAGDTFISTFAVSYLYEKNLLLAASRANTMATIAVTEPFTFVPTQDQIRQVWNQDY